MNSLFNNKGLTLVEVIMTLAILGAVICPLMNILVISQKINSEGQKDYRLIQTAQYYMEEVRAMGGINAGDFDCNGEYMCYEKTVLNVLDDYNAEIRVTLGSYGMHYIVVDIVRGGEVIDSLEGTIIFK